MAVVSMKQLLEAGVHFGHQTRRWNPKMAPYIFTERNGIYIIDLQKTVRKLEEAYMYVRSVAEAGGTVLFVGTKKQAQDSIREEAARCGMPFVNARWLGGMLTNFNTIQRRIKRLGQLKAMEEDGTFDMLPKKEVIKLRLQIEKLEKFLGGITEMKRQPAAMFIVDPRKERIAVAEARKLHIPITAGYYEDRYFRPGPAEAAFPLVALGEARLGLPTCWDQWFPELARAYSLAGAELLIYPTAIGSEPDHPEFDTEPLWERVIVANGIANGTFMVAINRIGIEPPLTFYGSSFISDPYGRILVKAPRDRPAVLIADLDLDQRRDWLELFPFLTTRRPDAYGVLTWARSS